FGDVPVVIARTRRGRRDELPAVGRPIIFVYVEIGGRDLLDLTRRRVNNRQTLLVDFLFYHARCGRRRLERAGGARRILGEQQRNRLAIRRPFRRGQKTCQVR